MKKSNKKWKELALPEKIDFLFIRLIILPFLFYVAFSIGYHWETIIGKF